MRAAGIESILDIGPPVDDRMIARLPLPMTRCGFLDSPSASAAMLRARVGVLDYPLDFAAKSGIFAAYAAHGVAPLIRGAAGGINDGLRAGLNLVRASEPLSDLRSAAPRIAMAAHVWYRKHRLEQAGASFARALHPFDA